MQENADSHNAWWSARFSDAPVIATAIHDGHGLREDVRARMSLSDADRLREEDPHTGQAVAAIESHVIVHRSRFECDLNRQREAAIYLTPEQSWGLEVWKDPPDGELLAELSGYHTAFYRMMATHLDELAARHRRFVLLDVHSYNHRREGPGASATPQEEAPDINIGTISMPRAEWAFLLDPLMDAMRRFDFNGRHLDVRENIAFQGRGALTRFVHERYPGRGCAIAIEFKKFFMDEWSGTPYPDELAAMRAFITDTAANARALLERAP